MSDIERTKAESTLDIRYAIRLHELHLRLYGRIRAALSFITLAGSSAALVSLLADRAALVAATAAAVAVAALFEQVFDFAAKVARRRVLIRSYYDLLARDLPLAEQDREMYRLRADGIEPGIESLRYVAFNDNVRRSGHEDWARPESAMQRLLRALA